MPPLAIPIIVGVGEAATEAYALYRAYRVAQAAYRIARAVQLAQKLAKAADKACATCAKKIRCFKKPEKSTEEEFERQLKDQEDGINNLSPDDLLKNIEKYRDFGRPAADAAARADVRSNELSTRTDALRDKYIAGGMGVAEAKSRAASDALSSMSGQDVLHTPDLRAGGDGTTKGLGDASANRSIGSQWGDGRADQLEQEAKDAKKRGDKKMNVKLDKC